ncbi:hypothetical protein DRO28_02670 [Candidatus Bathyarchaeota archaeon]|nr:MAG: hypothetical protein DRO28_02670 [Candidatus Bathyarchaeota archaeon]
MAAVFIFISMFIDFFTSFSRIDMVFCFFSISSGSSGALGLLLFTSITSMILDGLADRMNILSANFNASSMLRRTNKTSFLK